MVSFIGWAFVLLAVVFFTIGVVGFIKPSAINTKDGRPPTRLRMFLVAWLAPIPPALIGLLMLIPSSPVTTVASQVNPTPGTLTAADLQKPWPLTVSQVVVHCEDANHLTLEAGGKRYQLIGSRNPEARGWLRRDDIWAPSTTVPGLREDIGELVDVASSHCASIGKPMGGA